MYWIILILMMVMRLLEKIQLQFLIKYKVKNDKCMSNSFENANNLQQHKVSGPISKARYLFKTHL